MADHNPVLSDFLSPVSTSPSYGRQLGRLQRMRIKRYLFQMTKSEMQAMAAIRAHWTQKRRDMRMLRARPHPSRDDPVLSYRTIMAKTTSRIVTRAKGGIKSSKRTTVRIAWLHVPKRHRSHWIPPELARIVIDHLLQTDTNALLAVMRTCYACYQMGWEALYKDCTIRTGGPRRRINFPFDVLQKAQHVRSLTYTNTDSNIYKNERKSSLPELKVLDTIEQLFANPNHIGQLSNLQYLSLTLWRRRSYHFNIFSSLPKSLKGLDVYLPDTDYWSKTSEQRNLLNDFFAALPMILPQLEHLRYRAESLQNIVLTTQPLCKLKTLIFSTVRHHFDPGLDYPENCQFAQHLRKLYENGVFPEILEIKVISQQIGGQFGLASFCEPPRQVSWNNLIIRDIALNTTLLSPCIVGSRNDIWVRTTRDSPLIAMADASVLETDEDFVDLYVSHPSAQELLVQSVENGGTWVRTARPRCSRFPISYRDTARSYHNWSDEPRWHRPPDVIPRSFAILNALYLHEHVLQTRTILPSTSEGMIAVFIVRGHEWTGNLTPDLVSRYEAALPNFDLELPNPLDNEPDFEDELGFSTSDQLDVWEEHRWLPGENSDEVESLLTESKNSTSDDDSSNSTGSNGITGHTIGDGSSDFNLGWELESESESKSMSP